VPILQTKYFTIKKYELFLRRR